MRNSPFSPGDKVTWSTARRRQRGQQLSFISHTGYFDSIDDGDVAFVRPLKTGSKLARVHVGHLRRIDEVKVVRSDNFKPVDAQLSFFTCGQAPWNRDAISRQTTHATL